jgi:asparagine synthase (glutamine-hydrolysing)
MCGIAGIYGKPNEESGMRMLHRLAHRGPDGEGAIALPDTWLGHRRLAIVDPEGGRQPLCADDQALYLVGNGEIYNHKELRREFDEARFSSRSDNEVALHLVGRDGPGAMSRLHGMFALLIAGPEQPLVAARDPVGIKPLYWARRDGEVRFASEMRAFDADWRRDVELFPPGHYWTPEEGLVHFGDAVPSSWDDRYPPPRGTDDEPSHDLLQGLREAVVTAVVRRMMSDVPIGVFLSGGLDSSIVAGIAAAYARERNMTFHSFAVGSEGSEDLGFARLVAERLGTEHHERVFTAEEAQAVLPEVVRIIESYDPSLVRSAVPNYFLAELASRTVKVVLTGEGADELFAGYKYQQVIDGGDELHDEIVRTIRSLHGLNLQRCDRVTMFHGLEARVPFLDRDLIAFSLGIPAAWKLPRPDHPEKYLLRRAFEGDVADEVLEREKAEFGDGSGASVALRSNRAEAEGDGSEAPVGSDQGGNGYSEPRLRTEEEADYYRIFRQHLGEVLPERTIEFFATA